ncbi:glucosaminidase domain-containing protein, partial [Xanthovirga aplysinae]|uniref:glucosaminidase domain-containing protein n=1 Tax=Xanthovirga aplysinae TaxID=2529853 RepID=UPI0012BB542C
KNTNSFPVPLSDKGDFFSHLNFTSDIKNDKKAHFIELVFPSILLARQQFENEYNKTLRINEAINQDKIISASDSLFIRKKFEEFNTKNLNELLLKLKPHPASLILAQAALESGWGTSRFFKEGNNVFGIWSFSSKDKRIKAKENREGQAIHVKKYDNLEESISDYLMLLARSSAYKKFREKRIQTEDPLKLTPYLSKYSELREEYVNNLNKVIRSNKMTRFDNFRIEPTFAIKDWHYKP